MFDDEEMEKHLRQNYFDWLYDSMTKGRVHDKLSYRKMFKILHTIPFKYYIRNDINRAADGIELRTRFLDEFNYDSKYLDYLRSPCSVLEMMAGLAIRCEETIMSDTRYGDRTLQWFWYMMSSLQISWITDDIFNESQEYAENYIKEHIQNFLTHNYEPNGKGGLFYIRSCKEDMRNEEIWKQLCWFLNTIE